MYQVNFNNPLSVLKAQSRPHAIDAPYEIGVNSVQKTFNFPKFRLPLSLIKKYKLGKSLSVCLCAIDSLNS